MLLEVQRQAEGGEEEPGVLPVAVVVPPTLASGSSQALRPGLTVTVLGRLDIEVDYSFDAPRAYHSIIAYQIETASYPFGQELL